MSSTEAEFLAAHADWPHVMRVAIEEYVVPEVIADDFESLLGQSRDMGLAEVHIVREAGRAAIFLLLRDPLDVPYVKFYDASVEIVRGGSGAG